MLRSHQNTYFEGYAKVTFDKGAHGELKGNTVFQVKKDMEIDLTSEAPSVKPAEGWKFTEWDKDLKQTFTADTTITAQYKGIYADDVVVPEKDDDPTPRFFRHDEDEGTRSLDAWGEV